VAVTVAAVVLVVVAEVAATLSATAAGGLKVRHHRTGRPSVWSAPYGGEPHLSVDSAVRGPKMAAVRFVRDYARWSRGRLDAIPSTDATSRVIRLLEQQGRRAGADVAHPSRMLRLAPASAHTYVVTSAVGNFLIGRREPGWVVVSLPGD
jgi:hypothetical protein